MKVQSPRSPGGPSYRLSGSQANVFRTSISSPFPHSPRNPNGPRYVPSPTQPSFLPSTIPTPPHPCLTIYHILPPGIQPLSSLLHALCTSLRDPADRILRPNIVHTDWTPTAIFHLTGDFSTSFSSALCSVLLTRTSVSIDARGEEDVLGQHCFVHVFEAAHLAQTFSEMIGEWEQMEWAREVTVEMEDRVKEVLEACATGAVRSWIIGMGEDGGEGCIGNKMMEKAEEVLWGMWLNANQSLEPDEVQAGKWQMMRGLISRFGIW